METKKKKLFFNGLMIAGIVLFMIIGVAGIGVSKGWFGKDEAKTISAEKDTKKSDNKDKDEVETIVTTCEAVSISDQSVQAENIVENVTVSEVPVSAENENLSNVSVPLENEKTTEKNANAAKNDGNMSNSVNNQTAENETAGTGQQNVQAAATPVPQTPVPSVKTCKITIQCTTILNNINKLDSAKHSFVPKDGYILKDYTVEVKSGDVVFDILKRACDKKGIQLEYAFTPIYNSYYIEGINHLYEFDCGNQSGWMYRINNGLPQYGSSSCEVKENDNIEWLYTCEGLGADVGGSVN